MASPASFPVLRIGSFGEYVRLLQRALNVAPSQLPKLNPDAQFGPKTNSRVAEFQRQNSLVQDGVVGPITWGELQPFLDALSKIVDQSVPPAADEQAQRQRIVDVARSALQTFGWPSPVVVPDGSPRIAAARGFGHRDGHSDVACARDSTKAPVFVSLASAADCPPASL